MPTKTKTPPPMPGESGASRNKKTCVNSTGGSWLAAQRPAWEQLKSLGLIPLDEQYDCMKAVHSFYTLKLESLNPKPTGSVIELPPPWNLPPLPHATRKAQDQRKPAAKQQPHAQVHAADSIRVCPKCFAATPLPAAECWECGHQFQPERQELQHVKQSQQKREQPPRASEQPQETDLELIRAAADQVVVEDINRSRPQYLHRLRELVEESLSVPARDDLYRREIGEAIIRRDGIECNPFIGGCELPDDDDEWMVDGLVMAGALNIVGADPKAGKTLFSVSLIASLLHGCGEFIGRTITSRPQTIIIVGPDQAVKLWKRQLRAVGLVQSNTLDSRIVRLWDSRNPWAATPEGIAELRQVCAENPGSLVLVDSFAKVSEKLGIDENSREAAEVLTDIERACIVHNCTPLVIHHNAKAAGRVGIVNGAALRGNGAIRANASQLLILTLIEPDNPKDPRRRLVTEGRGTEFIDSVIQLEDDGRGWSHVCEFSEHRSAAKVEKAREKLTARQAEALRALEASDGPLTTAQVWAAAYPDEPWDKDNNECKQLSRTLGQLMDKRLVVRHPGIANRPTWSAA